MGPVQQIATIASAPESFTLVVMILGALFSLILGGYIFTWKSTRDLWKALADIKNNHLKEIEKRLAELEK